MNKNNVPLELLIVSDDTQFRDIGQRFYTPLVTQSGSTRFNVKTASKKDLSEALKPEENGGNGSHSHFDYGSDILLFDLRGDLKKSVRILDHYLSRQQSSYTIASVDPESVDQLLVSSTWQTLQRDIKGTAFDLTRRYRFPISKRIGGIKRQDYLDFFNLLNQEQFNETNLSFIEELKQENYEVIKRIIHRPTKFGEFSRNLREESPSRLMIWGLDRIAQFKPDETREMLEQIQPSAVKESIPQHCYPPFEDLKDITKTEIVEEIIPVLQKQGGQHLALYVHVPYCPGKLTCTYCDYSTIRGLKEVDRYLDHLKKEAQILYDLTGWNAITPKAIHIGGGTPSMLPVESILHLGDFLNSFFPNYKKNGQLTFEVSPSTINEEKLDAFMEIGAKRASVGLQSIKDEGLLRWLNRIYSEDKGKKAVNMLMERWEDNTNIDMMYGLPAQSIESWQDDLDAAMELKPPSITIYDLRTSSRTSFVKEQEYPTLYESMLMHVMAVERFLDEGYHQQSDNVFVRTPVGQEYVYKEQKKRGGNTLGLGLSSYSIFPGLQYHNIGAKNPHDQENLSDYFATIQQDSLPIEIGRFLDERDQRKLFMIQGLKLSGIDKVSNGVDMTDFKNRFNETVLNAFPHTMLLLEKGLLEMKDNYLGLSYKGLAFEPLVLKTYFT